MPLKSRICSSLSAPKNFLGNIFFLEKIFVLDQLVKKYIISIRVWGWTILFRYWLQELFKLYAKERQTEGLFQLL